MAKVTKSENEGRKSVEIEYSLWPQDGEAIAKMYEWENGEGFDLILKDAKLELTHCELNAIVALSGMFNCRLK